MATAASIMAAIASGGYHRLSEGDTLVALAGVYATTAGLTAVQALQAAKTNGYAKLSDGDLDRALLAVFTSATAAALAAAGTVFEAVPEGDTYRAVLANDGGGAPAATLLQQGTTLGFDDLSDRDLREALVYVACAGGSCGVTALIAKAVAYNSLSNRGQAQALISATS